MLIDRACEITGIRIHELNRVSLTALDVVIRKTKAEKDSDYVLKRHTRTEYIEAYETIREAVKRGEY